MNPYTLVISTSLKYFQPSSLSKELQHLEPTEDLDLLGARSYQCQIIKWVTQHGINEQTNLCEWVTQPE